MNPLKLNNSCDKSVKLHVDIFDILFKYRKEISAKLSNIRGLYNIDHVAIHILSPQNEVLILSSTPSVEYNLIAQELWRSDRSFSPASYDDAEFFCWDQAYCNDYANIIKGIKEKKHGYTFGFGLARKIGSLHLIYSYATRSKEKNLKRFYMNHKNELLAVGDYGFKLLHNISKLYCQAETSDSLKTEKRHLKLVVNNR